MIYECPFFTAEVIGVINPANERRLNNLLVELKESWEALDKNWYDRSYIVYQKDKNIAESALQDFCKEQGLSLSIL